MTEITPGVREFILAFADDEHLMGQQHTEWIGVTPFLEEDLAFASIGQDELGHAAMLYALVAGDDDAAIDELAFFRPDDEYRSCWLVERAGDDWADALMRHWMYDLAEMHRWELVAGSSLTALADASVLAEREEVFHRRHADSLLDALLPDTDARNRLEEAKDRFAGLALGMFEGSDGEDEAVAAGIAAAPLSSRLDAWQAAVDDRLGPTDWAAISVPAQDRRRNRSADFAALRGRMREVFDLDPAAVW
ncbi:MAG: 1,2-phenylacetyl-CoA epoxidase subunit PaaC [Actinomycetota bacterium]